MWHARRGDGYGDWFTDLLVVFQDTGIKKRKESRGNEENSGPWRKCMDVQN